MLFTYPDAIFDTRIDTQKIYVPMNFSFVLRNLKNKQGFSPLYLHATSLGKRVRINLDLRIEHKFWDKKMSRIKPQAPYAADYNLILDNIESKITKIKTYYRLSQKTLTLENFEHEFKNGLIRVDFLAFIHSNLENERRTKSKGTYKKNKSFYNKLCRFRKSIFFHELNLRTIEQYIAWCKDQNQKRTTINSDLSNWRKWLRKARQFGIAMSLQPEDFKVGNKNGNREDLKPNEVKLLLNYYHSEFITPRCKHALGIFLFVCFTGLRIGDVKRVESSWLHGSFLDLVNSKTDKNQRIPLTRRALELFHEINWEHKISEQKLRDALHDAVKGAGLRKNVTYHVGRHTFATNYLRAGGKVERLQKLLNHSSIRTTMIYVHIIEQELESDIHFLDDIY